MTSNNKPRILAITACPTGIAHTYMAAEKLTAAAAELNMDLKVETHGSIGVEGTFSEADVAAADAVLVAADTAVDKERFAGKRLLTASVSEAIKNPNDLLTRAQSAPVYGAGAGAGTGQAAGGESVAASETGRAGTSVVAGNETGKGSLGRSMYQALMNGVSHMIPFVVCGGLMIAVALSLGGQPTPEGLKVPEDSFWNTILQIGSLAFSLMVPVLSAFIASGIAGRPGLAPGFITGLIATTGSLYGTETGAGFIGGIITGFLSGYVALAIRKIRVNKYLAAIWPIIVIPILTTTIVGLLFVYLLGNPIAALFENLTQWLSTLDGASMIILGAILGAMIAFDMGGPFNKTAFLFGGGMIASGNAAPMGMTAAAIAVPPLAVGVATLLRRKLFTQTERDSGIAALFMGFFGITEGAIPLAAARPLQVIPANVAGGATAGALAGLWGVKDNVMHGGPIVALLGAVDGVALFFLALLAGIAVTVAVMLTLLGLSTRRAARAGHGLEDAADRNDERVPATAAAATAEAGETEPARASTTTAGGSAPMTDAEYNHTGIKDLIHEGLIVLDQPVDSEGRDSVIDSLARVAGVHGRFTDSDQVVIAAFAREDQGTTAVGHGVAIPHARCAAVKKPTLVFARLAEPGVEWSAPDAQPVRLVFLVAVPESAGDEHLRILSKLARSLMREPFRQELLTARTETQALTAINGALN
ncbi:fructose-specific PTS transporter subunit EIIC [Rothia sp. LK2588]|uniref:fructose-specific PTS transporter subunit EIIC n=1 Tax=Rothia sp. LK2588 TaxID=3114369 RepID=UPI0034CF538B